VGEGCAAPLAGGAAASAETRASGVAAGDGSPRGHSSSAVAPTATPISIEASGAQRLP
jgi:hypothetical protein